MLTAATSRFVSFFLIGQRSAYQHVDNKADMGQMTLSIMSSNVGGWQQVTMQYLGHDWCQLWDLGEEARNVAHAAAARMLETIQGSSHVQLGGGSGVHGDLRSSNIMVRRVGPSQICFVDFDWAGMEGAAR